MKINSYEFGRIFIEGKEYRNDLIIFPERVKDNWWRKEGHSLSLEDISDIIKENPEILVIGKGYSGMMKVPEKIKEELKERKIKVKIANTKEAIQIYNDLKEKGKKIIAALHLTC